MLGWTPTVSQINRPLEDREIKVFARVDDEPLEIDFTDGPNGVQVRCGRIVRPGNCSGEVRNVPDEQSYFVKYPLKLHGCQYDASHRTETSGTDLSSTFALPRTKSPPSRPRTHGSSWANRYESTILKRAWMFCIARFSLSDPPWTRKRGLKPVIKVKRS